MTPYHFPFVDFVKLMATSRTLVTTLLQQESNSPTKELLERLQRLCQEVDRMDCYHLESELELPEARRTQLGLNTDESQAICRIPLTLYRRYCTNIMTAYLESGHYQLSEEEIIYLLTGGAISIRFIFLIRTGSACQVCRWGFDFGSIIAIVIEDDDVREQCVRYLLSRGACFVSEQDLLDYAVRMNWPYVELAAKSSRRAT